MLDELIERLAGVKFGVPTIASLGLWRLSRLLHTLKGQVYLLADMKVADVSHVSRSIVRIVGEAGFDGIIAHAIVGLRGGLAEVVDEARECGLEVYALVAMSHPGAEEVLNRNFEKTLRLALDAGVDGLVLPATMPSYISKAREKAPQATIISPGIGAQGASPGSAISAGADFEIVGRTILNSDDPPSKLLEVWRRARWRG